MRPYLAIIKDSFRAAMASRVLYVLLLLITLLLLALAPLHLSETLDWQLSRESNVRNPDRLLRRLVECKEDPSATEIKRIWELLPDSLRQRMVKIVERPDEGPQTTLTPGQPSNFVVDMQTQEELIKQLNEIIENPKFYRESDWSGQRLPSEAQGLIDQGVDNLSAIRVKRLNRLLVAKAVSPMIDTGNASALDFSYGPWRIPFPISATHQQFAHELTAQLPYYFDKFVLSIGLCIAIVVTANMVPETFEPGSLNLLLSKPISRWGLYTAKFVGGCVFIALCAAYLFLGVWLWIGLRMGVWDRAMLLSIPLYILVFAIYFSVSAFIGLVWRSAIVSVILTLLFWGFCFAIGSGFGAVKTKMNNSEFINLLPAGAQICASDVLHQFYRWDPVNREWDQKIKAELGQEGEMILGINSYFVPLRAEPTIPGLKEFLDPVYDRPNNRLIASRYEFGKFSSSGQPMLVSDLDEMNFTQVGKFPNETLKIVESATGIIAVTASGAFHRLNQSENDAPTGELFKRIGPLKRSSIRNADQVGYSRFRDEFAVYQKGTIKIYAADADSYQFRASLDLELGFDKSMTTLLAYAGETILLAFGNGKVITVDAEKLKPANEFHLESRAGVRQVGGSVDGKFLGVLFSNGGLWLLDQEHQLSPRRANVLGQGQIGSFAFDADQTWWVSDNTDRVTQYDLVSESRVMRHAPRGGWLAQVYRYGLRPFYRICPKPGEFYKVVTQLSSSGDTRWNENVDLNKTLPSQDPWLPLWSGLAFMGGMLVLGCLVFHFKDY
jgi:ABC-type transport system involved in multi-copper enzyme maturation permease subunit